MQALAQLAVVAGSMEHSSSSASTHPGGGASPLSGTSSTVTRREGGALGSSTKTCGAEVSVSRVASDRKTGFRTDDNACGNTIGVAFVEDDVTRLDGLACRAM